MSIDIIQYTTIYITLQIAPQQYSTCSLAINAAQVMPSKPKANN